MARLSTGKSYGDTGRRTPQQLLGGTSGSAPQGGELAQRQLPAAVLQPQAQPVNTFIEAGSPTLGGPVRMFAPPDLPAPNQDMANLAKALSSFNPALQQVGQVYVEDQKRLDTQRKQEGADFAMQVQRVVGAYTGITDAQRLLEKRANEGDPGAQRLLQYLISRHPGMRAYLAESTQENALLMGAARLPGLMRNTSMIPDGMGGQIELRSLSPDDPRLLDFIQKSLISDEVVSPRAMAKHQQLLIAAQNSARENHEQRHIGYNVDQHWADTNLKLASLGAGYAGPEPLFNVAQVTGNLQALLDDARFIGLPEKERKEFLTALPARWRDAVYGSIAPGEIGPTAEQIFAPFANLMVGPEDQRFLADGTQNQRLTFVNMMGGASWLQQQIAEAQTAWLQRYNRNEQVQGIEAKNFAYDLAREVLTPEIMQSPDLAEAAWRQGRLTITKRFRHQPDMMTASLAALDKIYSDSFSVYNDQEIEDRELQYSVDLQRARMDPQYARQLQQRLVEDARLNRVSQGFATSNLSTLASFQESSNRPLLDMLDGLSSAKLSEWEKLSKDPRSYGQELTNEFEVNAGARAQAQMKEEGWRVIREGRAAGKSDIEIQDNLQKLFEGRNWGLKPRQLPVEQTQAYSTVDELHSKNKAGWLSGTIPPDRGNYLKGQARVRALFGAESLEKELDAIIGGGQMSPAMKETMRAVTTGPNKLTPSEFFIQQLRFHDVLKDVSPEDMQKIKALDGTLKVSAAPARPQTPAAQNPYIAMLRNMGGQVVNTAVNALVPPAAAAPAPMGVASRGPARPGSTSLLGVIREIRGANQFRGVSLIKNKRPGDYQSDPRENWFFDFKPDIVPKALARAKKLTEQDVNALAFTALTEAGPTDRGKLEVAANLINRSAIAGNKPIVDIAKAPNQYEGVFGYSKTQVISAAEGRRIFGRRYDQVRKLIAQGI